jgi:hypothetical protein
MKNKNSLPDLQKQKKLKIAEKKRKDKKFKKKKRNSMTNHLSTPISFPESSPSVFGREILKQMNLFLEYANSVSFFR